MAKLLGRLRVVLDAQTEDFRRGLTSARKNLDTFEKSITKFSKSTIAQVASITALVAAVKQSIDTAAEYEKANNALAASARLAGQDLATLRGIVAQGRSQFGLSIDSAQQFALQISRLADEAGGLKDPSRVLQAFLDIGASRGLSATESLQALTQAVKLSDDGITVLLNKKPDELFDKFAASVHTTASALSQQGKAQALVNQVLADGDSVRGQYQEWLQSTEGIQYRLSSGMADASTVVGEAFQPALAALIPVMKVVSSVIATIGVGITAVIADMQEIPALAQAAGQALVGNFTLAEATFKAGEARWRETVDRARALVDAASKATVPVGPLAGRGSKGGDTKGTPNAARDAAMQRQDIYFEDSIAKAKAQHDLDLEKLGAQASIADKLQLELDLNQQIYQIKRQQVLEDQRLSKSGKDNALLRAKLEKETADYQARGHATNEQAQKDAEAQAKALKDKASTIGDVISGTIGAATSGGLNGAMIGQNVGMLAGAFMPAIAPFAAGIGGYLGGLFDKKHKDDAQAGTPIVKGLDAIERAQRETITTIQAQTDALLHPENRLLNLPSTFAIPEYRPNTGRSITYADTTNVTLNLTVNGAQTPTDIQSAVEDALANALYGGRRSQAWN